MRTRLRRDLTAAIKNRDRVTVAAVRSALAAIENAEAPPTEDSGPHPAQSEHLAGSAAGHGAAEVTPRDLTEADLHAIVESEVLERAVAAQEYERLGRDDLAQRLRSEAEVLGRYLPAD